MQQPMLGLHKFQTQFMRYLLRQFSRYFAYACLLMGMHLSAFAEVHDHISQRAFWEDASALATWEVAQTKNFTPYEGVLSRGYTASAVWIRLEITPSENASTNENLIVRIRPIYLDEITLFDPLDHSGITRKTGDQTQYKNQEYTSLSHAFVIPSGNQPRYIWLRLKATSTALMHIEVLSKEGIQQDEHHLLLSYYFALSLIMIFLIVVLINWINYREFLYAAFVIRNIIYLVYTAAFFGFHRYLLGEWIDAKYLDLGYNWLVVGTTAFSFWFETRFLDEYEPPKWVKYIFRSMLLWSATAAFLLGLGYVNQGLKVNMLLNGAGIFVLLFLATVFINDKKAMTYQTASLLKKKFVVGYYAIIAALLLFSVLPYLGKMAGSEFSANGLVYYALISGLDMTILMQLRANQLRKANIQTAQDLALSTQQVELEKIRREEQSQMLTMLMHELKNPLAVIDLAQQASDDSNAKDYVSRNVSIIRDVLDQCLNADRLLDGKITIQQQRVDLIELIDDLMEAKKQPFDRFQLNYLTSLISLSTDYQCLRIVLSNLIDNALRYGDTSQAIQIEVAAQSHADGQSGIAICIANKPGIASWPEADKVFHKYYRSTGAKSISGTGLGLFLVRSICTLLGGACTYEPDDTDVRFKVWLPN
jgi:two-component system, sensor histidine kinase LadS